MNELRGLRLNRRDQMRMGVAERVDRNAAGEIQIALAVGGEQPRALASLERQIGAGENGKKMRLRYVAHDDDFNLMNGRRPNARSMPSALNGLSGKQNVPPGKAARHEYPIATHLLSTRDQMHS